MPTVLMIATTSVLLSGLLIAWIVPQHSRRRHARRDLLWLVGQDQYEYTVLDLRPPGEFAAGHIPQAINVSPDHILSYLPTENMFERIYTCGRTASMAKRASRILGRTGYFNVESVGAFRHWRGPVEESQSAEVPSIAP